MEDINKGEIESKLDKICNDIKGEISIHNAVGVYNNREKALFDTIFPEIDQKTSVKHNVKWFNGEANNVKSSVEHMQRNGCK